MRLFLCLVLLLSSFLRAAAQNCVTINLPDTLKACSPATVVLNASLSGAATYQPIDTTWTPTAGLSNPDILNPTASVGPAGQYYVLTIKALSAQNLVVNGDFSSGNTGFISSYVYGTGGTYGPLSTEGEYVVMTDPLLAHNQFTSFGDHTSGTGNMMVVNGAATANVNIWCQSVPVTAATEYDFSTWGATAFPNNPAILQFSINNVLLGTPFNLSGTPGIWQQFHTIWQSGAATTATICITNQNTAIFGNDFALDDIHFHTTCTARDSVFVVSRPSVHSSFTATVLDSCADPRATFVNQSGNSSAQYLWLFGDNTTYAGAAPPVHHYPSNGTYTVKLVLIDPAACNSPDTASRQIHFNGTRLKAAGSIPDLPCGQFSLAVSSSTSGADSVRWFFGDGASTAQPSAVHSYAGGGTYTVMLVAYSNTACNKSDTLKKILLTGGVPVASFVYAPVEANRPVQFTNYSTGATAYRWSFGDGAESDLPNPSHQYAITGNYTVCLTAINGVCADTLCKPLYADATPVVDVPKAFTPNGDGHNDVLFVRGVGVVSISFKLFNRWGGQVFESESLDRGWDGSVNGIPQDMETYAYLLRATFVNGTSLTRKGNVTLIR